MMGKNDLDLEVIERGKRIKTHLMTPSKKYSSMNPKQYRTISNLFWWRRFYFTFHHLCWKTHLKPPKETPPERGGEELGL